LILYRIAGNVYYVGTNFLASYLFVTPEGSILLNSDYEESVPWSAPVSKNSASVSVT